MSKAKTHRKAAYSDLADSPLVKAVELAKSDQERVTAIRTLLTLVRAGKVQASPLSSSDIIPDGSPLKRWMVEWKQHSVIPAELVFWVPFQLIGQYLMDHGARIDMAPGATGDVKLRYCYTNTYILHCGDAGVGKGIVEDLTWACLGTSGLKSIGRVGSPEAFLQALEDHDAVALLQSMDEWPVIWELLKSDKAFGDILIAYLRAFRQQSLELKYLKKTYECELPLFSIMAFAQPKRLFQVLAPEDYSNGFVRRHIITFSPTVKLSLKDQHRYDPQFVADSLRGSGIIKEWQDKLASVPIHQDYTMDKAATEYIRYHVLKAGIDLGLESGYVTTALYTARKFALIYHYIMGETGSVIGRKAAEYAVNLVRLTLHDLQFLMDEGRRSTLSNLIEEALQLRLDLTNGKKQGKWDHRKLQQNIHIEDVATARFVYDVVSEIDLEELAMAEAASEEQQGAEVLPFQIDGTQLSDEELVSAVSELKAQGVEIVPAVSASS